MHLGAILGHALQETVRLLLVGVEFGMGCFARLRRGGRRDGDVPRTADVQRRCTISATDMNFEDYESLRPSAQSEIQVNCTTSANRFVGLNQGRCSDGTIIVHCMIGPGSSLLNYNLYSNAATTDIWGNTIGTDSVSGIGNRTVQIITAYRVVPGGQSVEMGGYINTITAAITF